MRLIEQTAGKPEQPLTLPDGPSPSRLNVASNKIAPDTCRTNAITT